MLSAIILTLDEERHLPDCLASLTWADEIVVFDSFSADRTCELARNFGARVVQHRFENYARQRNAALEAVEADWVFFLDADERATPAVGAEILQVARHDAIGPRRSAAERHLRAASSTANRAGGWIPRHNYIFGRLTLHAGWYPDYQMRLLRRGRARYVPERPVHELVELDGAEWYLHNPLVHLNYDTVAEFIAKQHEYAAYDASVLHRRGWRPRPHHFLSAPVRQFYWRFFTLHGYRAGWHGLKLSGLMAYFEWVKFRQLSRGHTMPT